MPFLLKNQFKQKMEMCVIPPLGNNTMLFVRQFRYTICSEHLGDWNSCKVDVDWFNKSLIITAYELWVAPDATRANNPPTLNPYEVNCVPAVRWATDMQDKKYPDESLYLATYDGCGNMLYGSRFTGLNITGRNSTYDYESTDAARHKITISYKNAEPFDREQWYVTIPPEKEEKECKLHHLHSTITLP